MNKLVKGSIAGAAGIALLLGGAGTLASWNSSATVSAADTITAGTLDITATTGATDGWKLGTGATTATLGTKKIVPGDTLTYTKSFNVMATGDNLTATAGLGALAISPATPADPEDVALAAALTKTATFTIGGAATTVVSPAAGTQTVVVTVTITYPKSATAGAENSSKTGAVKLDSFTITLNQS